MMIIYLLVGFGLVSFLAFAGNAHPGISDPQAFGRLGSNWRFGVA